MPTVIQLSVVGVMLTQSPSNDRLMTLLVGSQFALEGLTTSYLLVQSILPDVVPSATAQPMALILALLSMLAPIVQRLYDAVVVQLCKLRRKDGGFTVKGAVTRTAACAMQCITRFPLSSDALVNT